MTLQFSSENIHQSAVGGEGHRENRYLPDEGVYLGLLHQRLSSADSNHLIPQITPGENSLGPVRICWKVKAHAVYLRVCMFHKHCV